VRDGNETGGQAGQANIPSSAQKIIRSLVVAAILGIIGMAAGNRVAYLDLRGLVIQLHDRIVHIEKEHYAFESGESRATSDIARVQDRQNNIRRLQLEINASVSELKEANAATEMRHQLEDSMRGMGGMLDNSSGRQKANIPRMD